MTITNFSALMAQIVDLLKENDREKPQYSVKIMMNVNAETGEANAFTLDSNEDSQDSLCLGTRPAHYDDTWLNDMCDGLEISDIADLLEVDEQSLIYDTNVYKYGGEAEPEEITVQDVENYVYHNPALWEKVQSLYIEFLEDSEPFYYDAVKEIWSNFVECYNYESRECGQDLLHWEG